MYVAARVPQVNFVALVLSSLFAALHALIGALMLPTLTRSITHVHLNVMYLTSASSVVPQHHLLHLNATHAHLTIPYAHPTIPYVHLSIPYAHLNITLIITHAPQWLRLCVPCSLASAFTTSQRCSKAATQLHCGATATQRGLGTGSAAETSGALHGDACTKGNVAPEGQTQCMACVSGTCAACVAHVCM